jgi:acyl carrier protein
MAVVGVIAAIEDRFGISVDDDEISGATFATFDSLVNFVSSKTE